MSETKETIKNILESPLGSEVIKDLARTKKHQEVFDRANELKNRVFLGFKIRFIKQKVSGGTYYQLIAQRYENNKHHRIGIRAKDTDEGILKKIRKYSQKERLKPIAITLDYTEQEALFHMYLMYQKIHQEVFGDTIISKEFYTQLPNLIISSVEKNRDESIEDMVGVSKIPKHGSHVFKEDAKLLYLLAVQLNCWILYNEETKDLERYIPNNVSLDENNKWKMKGTL